VKKLWDYIKSNELQNPAKKQEIICDGKLRALFNVDRVHMFTMNKVQPLLVCTDDRSYRAICGPNRMSSGVNRVPPRDQQLQWYPTRHFLNRLQNETEMGNQSYLLPESDPNQKAHPNHLQNQMETPLTTRVDLVIVRTIGRHCYRCYR
jgi:hypothetical protein